MRQLPGEFMLAMPRAFHFGVSHGFKIAETATFAASEWLPWGLRAAQVTSCASLSTTAQ